MSAGLAANQEGVWIYDRHAIVRLGEADVALIRSKTKATAAWQKQAPNLKLIIRGGVGTDNIDKVCAAEKGIVVHNTPKAPSIAVAELAFAMMLAVPNHIVKANESMRMGEWLKKELKRTELHGKTLGLVGIGNIAQAVAAINKAVLRSRCKRMRPVTIPIKMAMQR